jgi:hypothetical protein
MRNIAAGLALVLLLCPYGSFGISSPSQAVGDEEQRSWISSELFYHFVYFNDEVFEDAFDKDFFPGAGLSIGFYPIRNLEVSGKVMAIYEKGYAIGELTGEESGESFTLTVYPLQFSMTYVFDFLNEQILVPSLSAGGDYYLYSESREFGDDIEGGKAGYHAGAGLALLLDRLDPESAGYLQKEFGVKNVFLKFNYEWAVIGEKDEGLDFSNQNYSAGLVFEF